MKKILHYAIMTGILMSLFATGTVHSLTKAPTGRAFSLREFNRRIESWPATKKYSKELVEFAGITRMDGYVIDEKHQDIILFGAVDPSLPSLYAEDLIIALKNMRHDYVEKRGDTLIYSHPSCSIDPDPKVIARLQQVEDAISKTDPTRNMKRRLQVWEKICDSPQQVNVYGVPFNSRFAKVMVQADYDMKLLVNGSDSLGIPGFVSLTDMIIAVARTNMNAGGQQPVPLASLERFWLSPGENRFLQDEGIFVIDNCSVKLQTEAEHLSKAGKLVGTGKAFVLSQQFANNFTVFYSEIARLRPIYAELENLFRFVALAKIWVESPNIENILDLSAIGAKYQIQKTPVDRTLPGRSFVKSYSSRQDSSGGYNISQMWLPSCGGVGIEFQRLNPYLSRDLTAPLQNQRNQIINSRPVDERQLDWEVPLIWYSENEQFLLEHKRYAVK